MFLTTSKRYTKIGEEVTPYNFDHWPVVLVVNERGVEHSCLIEELSDEPVIVEVHEEPKPKKQREIKKPLTQAEKIQLEYLNSLK